MDNANIYTTAVSPKQYFEKFKNSSINKKYRVVRRDTPRMNFESYTKKSFQKKVFREVDSKRMNKKNDTKRITS